MFQENVTNSIIVNTDSYKVSMPNQYPPGTTHVFSYIESRGGKYDEVVFFGLQSFIKNYLLRRVTKADIDFAEKFWLLHGEPFDRSKWDYIVKVYHGKLPVRIKAVAEGTVVPVGHVMCTIENTDPECWWLTTWIETALLRGIWYPTTVATVSRSIKVLIKGYLEKSGDLSGLPFKLHDFGARGAASYESNALGSAAHLVNFMGTDSPQGIMLLHNDYEAALDTIGFSIPAAEHSTITSWGRANEALAYENMVVQFSKPGSIYAVVSDSYDIFKAMHMWGQRKEQVINGGGTLVIRPDSGDPQVVLSRLLFIAESYFGSTKNAKGYKVLNNVRFIWGDGIDELAIAGILRRLVDLDGWSADNVAFGMGGALLQKVDRDTQKFAMKCSSAKVNGAWIDVFKDPITDKGKTSKRGRLDLYKANGAFDTGLEGQTGSLLDLVYEDGDIFRVMNLASVRKNAEV